MAGKELAVNSRIERAISEVSLLTDSVLGLAESIKAFNERTWGTGTLSVPEPMETDTACNPMTPDDSEVGRLEARINSLNEATRAAKNYFDAMLVNSGGTVRS